MLRTLYPEIEPYKTLRFRVSELHELHVEEAGNPNGVPVIFFHGGPGAGTSSLHRRFFDPSYWRVILFDQRGSGKSSPLGELRENTTWNLVEDVEKIRESLGLERWYAFGGSWGSTLAVAYAETHPERVRGLVLRGIFLSRKTELDWTFVDGARRIFPDGWDEFVAPLTLRERGDVLHAYHRRLTGHDIAARRAAAIAWNLWEERASRLVFDGVSHHDSDVDHELAVARIEAHYFVNGSFFEPSNQLLRDTHRLKGIPGVIVQGRYDIVCPATSAWELHRAWPESRLELVDAAGHAADEAGISDALVRAVESFQEK